jgi:hypothetical protein
VSVVNACSDYFLCFLAVIPLHLSRAAFEEAQLTRIINQVDLLPTQNRGMIIYLGKRARPQCACLEGRARASLPNSVI